MPTCCVPGCTNRSGKGGNVRFFEFPKDSSGSEQWATNISRKNPTTASPWKPRPRSAVCSVHFVNGRPSKEHPHPTKDLGHGKQKRRYRKKTSAASESSAETVEQPASINLLQVEQGTSPKLLKRIHSKERSTAASSASSSVATSAPLFVPISPKKSTGNVGTAKSPPGVRKPAPRPVQKSPEFSPSGARIFYKSSGITAKEPTPQRTPRRYRDPTNPNTPDTGRRKRLAAVEESEIKKKRRKLDELVQRASALVPPAAASSPTLPIMVLPDETVSMERWPSRSFLQHVPPELLNETFTESDLEVDQHSRATSVPADTKRRGRKKQVERPHVFLTSLTDKQIVPKMIDYRQKYHELQSKVSLLEAELELEKAEKNFGWHRIVENDDASRLWTGFPSYQVFEKTYSRILLPDAEQLALKAGDLAEKPRKRALSAQDEFLFTMVRLRTNISTKQLAFLFGVRSQYAGRLLKTWIPFLAEKLRFIVSWIPREERKQLPQVFRGLFKKCVGVLDCFELQVQKPANMAHRQQLWSEYKQRHTAKFLVVMVPNGSIIYISKAYGGRISDVDLVKRSKEFLKNLQYGDELLADRGFRMVEWFSLNHHVYLWIPAFLKDGNFAMNESHRTRKLAKARIHVERCIGQLRTFKILSEIIPVRLFKHIDDISIICSAVCNLRPPIVPLKSKRTN